MIHVATTLLGMVDDAVGGKTGVNLPSGGGHGKGGGGGGKGREKKEKERGRHQDSLGVIPEIGNSGCRESPGVLCDDIPFPPIYSLANVYNTSCRRGRSTLGNRYSINY